MKNELVVFDSIQDFKDNSRGRTIIGRSAAVDAAMLVAKTSGVLACVVQTNRVVLLVDDYYIVGTFRI